MEETNDVLWLAFEALARTYPHDGGVRMTADLARWLVEERQRQQMPAPEILQKIVRSIMQKPHEPAVQAGRAEPPN